MGAMTDTASSITQLWRYVQDDDPSAFTLIVETPNGPYMRRIPPALPLPSGVEHGPGAEAAAHTAAATWGMPDFVFQQAEHATKGSGLRELGDRLLLAGRRGAVVQVKARTIKPKPDDSVAEADRFTVLSDFDRLPVPARAEWGHLLLDMLRDVPEVPDEHCKWRFRRLLEEDGARQLIVGAATRFDPIVLASFSAYVQLRHHEVTARTGMAEESSTLGVLLTPRHDGVRPWDTNVVRVHGDLDLSDEEIQVYSEAWNRAAEDAESA